MGNTRTTTLARHRKHPFHNLLMKIFKNRRKRNHPSSTRTKRRNANNNQHVREHHASPTRRMPTEIQVAPGTPDSMVSNVSGATGLPPDLPRSMSKSMFKSVLPEMQSETEECSMDRSTFTWTSYSNKNSGSGKSSKRNNSPPFNKSMFVNGDDDDDDDDQYSPKNGPVRNLFFGSPQKKRKKKEGNFFTRTKTFQKMVAYAFNTVDIDQSGSIDKKELYTGLLLIHLKIASYGAGPAACRPASKEYVDGMFDMLDEDKNGTLNNEEFTTLMTILCSQLTTRIILQLSMTLIIVPIMAQYIVDFFQFVAVVVTKILIKIDDAEVITEMIMSFLSRCWDGVLMFTPPIIQSAMDSVSDAVGDGLMDAMPLTVMSCLLGMIIVPWMLFKCDEFYNKVAIRKSMVPTKKIPKLD